MAPNSSTSHSSAIISNDENKIIKRANKNVPAKISFSKKNYAIPIMKFNTNEDGSLKMDEAQYATIKANIKTAPTPSKKRAWTTF